MDNDNSSYILTEIWRARSAWYDLSAEQRVSYFEEKIGPLLMGIMGKGGEVLACAVNDNTGEQRIDYQFMAVWKFPNKEISDQLELGAKDADFLEYFEQVNFSGKSISPPVLNETMINL